MPGPCVIPPHAVEHKGTIVAALPIDSSKNWITLATERSLVMIDITIRVLFCVKPLHVANLGLYYQKCCQQFNSDVSFSLAVLFKVYTQYI